MSVINYTKPGAICNAADNELLNNDDFIAVGENTIIKELSSMGYTLRKADFSDILNIINFMNIRYKDFPPQVVSDVSQYDIYRFIEFGHGLVIEDTNGNIVASVFEEPYNSIDKTSYTVRIASDLNLVGKNLGYYITLYSCILAYKNKSKVKRALIAANNYASATILINKMGWLADGFNLSYFPNIGPAFSVCLPLTKSGLLENRLSTPKLLEFIKTKQLNVDFRLIKCDDYTEIDYMYNIEKKFVIAAYLKQGIYDNANYYVALPYKVLHIKYK